METLQSILRELLALPPWTYGALIAAVIVVLVFKRLSRPGVNWNSRVLALQKRFRRAELDKRIATETPLHSVMARALRQWPHAPMVFYQAALAAVEEITASKKLLAEWPEAQGDTTLMELAHEFELLVRAVAAARNPRPVVGRSFGSTALKARAQHIQRMKALGG